MAYLGTIDWAVIVIYFVFLVSLGLYLKKRASESIEDYLIGGRKMPWWMLGVSGMANFLDITGTMIIVSFLFMLGPRGLYIEFRGGAVLVLAFFMLWGGKWHRRSQVLTGAEWMIYRFGDGPDGRFAQFFQALAGIVGTVGMLAYLIVGVGMFLSMFLPFNTFWCAVLMISVATVYTMISGFYGVVFTDLFQALFILIAVLFISTMAFLKIGEVESMAVLAQQVTGNSNWMGSIPQWETSMPAGYEQYKHLILFAFFYLLKNTFAGVSGGADPKYFGARNDRECGQLTFLWTTLMMFRWPMMIGFAVLGVFLVSDLFPDQIVLEQATALIKEHIPEVEASGWAAEISTIINKPESYPEALIDGLQNLLGAETWKNKLHLVSFHGNVNPERILPAVLLFNIPMGLRGLLLIALIAASMSTFDSSVNATCGYMTRDIYQKHLRPNASTKELIYASWFFVVLLVVSAFILAFSIKSINDIWGWIIMGLGGGLMIPTFLRFFWWRFNGSGFAVGTAVGLVAAIIQRSIAPDLDERLQFLIMGAIGFTASIAGTYLAPPTKREVLEHFYRTTRPFGAWGKLFHELPQDARQMMKKEHFRDIITSPFALLWQVCLFLLPMQIILHAWNEALVTGILFLIGLAGIYFIWFRHLPEDNYPVPEWHAGDDVEPLE